jgi:hypothetical protein
MKKPTKKYRKVMKEIRGLISRMSCPQKVLLTPIIPFQYRDKYSVNPDGTIETQKLILLKKGKNKRKK